MLQDGCQPRSSNAFPRDPTTDAAPLCCQKLTTVSGRCGLAGPGGGFLTERRWFVGRTVWAAWFFCGLAVGAPRPDTGTWGASCAAAAAVDGASGAKREEKARHARKPYPPYRDASATAKVPEKEKAKEQAKEPAPAAKVERRILDGKTYLLVGSGEFASDKSPSYRASLYLEHAAARVQFGSLVTRAPTRAEMMSENRAQYFVTWGKFAKWVVLTFSKPATKAELATMFRTSMPELFSDRTNAELSKDAEAFVQLFDKDMAAGSELGLHISEQGQIAVYVEGKKAVGPQNLKLSRHVLDIWLGYHSAARTLRNVLVGKLDVLKTPVPRSSP